MSYKFKQRRLRFKLWRRSIMSNAKKYELDIEQKRAITLATRTIVEKDSILLCSAESELGSKNKPRYIIRNTRMHVDIRITYNKIRVKNGILKYDVMFIDGNPSLRELKALFAKNMERRLDKIEDEINNDVI